MTTATLDQHYRRGPLRTASVRFWRAAGIMLAVILINAIIQGLLVAPGVTPQLNNPVFLLMALVSLASLVIGALLMATAALEVWAGRISIRRTIRLALPNLAWFTVVTLIWAVIALIGLSFYTWPGLVILALTPYVPLAAANGQRNVLKANFLAIRERFGRYVVTLVITGLFFFLLGLLESLFNFLIFGGASAFIAMFFGGLIVSWLAVGWALVYRSTAIGRATPNPDAQVGGDDPQEGSNLPS